MKGNFFSFKEFLAFLLIYASHADINFSDEEKQFIREKVSDPVFDKVHGQFNELTDYQALEVILSYKEYYFPNKQDKKHLFEELHNLFHADGDFSYLEKELLTFLDRIM